MPSPEPSYKLLEHDRAKLLHLLERYSRKGDRDATLLMFRVKFLDQIAQSADKGLQ